MSALTIRGHCVWSCSVNLFDRGRELGVFDDMDRFTDKLMPQLERLRYVDYVEDRHQFWARIEPETSDPLAAARRVEKVLAKIDRLLVRYGSTKS